MVKYTDNRSYPKPDFDTPSGWHEQVAQALDMIDVDMGGRIAFEPFIISEIWRNGELYHVDDVLVDDTDNTLWKCLIEHTSPAAGTFSASRAAVPTNWLSVGTSLRIRGAWANNTTYQALDHVYDTTEGISAICSVGHISNAGGTIRDDVANWAFIVDVQGNLTEATKGQLVLQGQVFGG